MLQTGYMDMSLRDVMQWIMKTRSSPASLRVRFIQGCVSMYAVWQGKLKGRCVHYGNPQGRRSHESVAC
jgi:hypothetical protein